MEKSKVSNKVYISFQTERVTSGLLKTVAHKMGKTQAELINEICENYLSNVLDLLEEKGFLIDNEE